MLLVRNENVSFEFVKYFDGKVVFTLSVPEDILCQVEKLPVEVLNIHSVKVRGNSAYLTIIIPETLLPTFQDFLQSALSISRYIQTRITVEKAIQKARDVSVEGESRKRFEKQSEIIVSKFDSFVESGLPARQAIRQTKEVLNNGGYELTCYMVELIVRDAGRLSKRKKKAEVKS
jgi:hypothetical protein